MKVDAFALVALSAPLFVASGATAGGIVGVSTRLVDPVTQVGQSGSWAANGYPTDTLDTYRVYAQFNGSDRVVAVGDLFIAGTVMNLSTDAPTFYNAIGHLGNNGLRSPVDHTSGPGPNNYTSQWDSYVAIWSETLSLSPGLTTALGATTMGMGGLIGNSFSIDNSSWSTTPANDNTVFNPQSGYHEVLILQLTVAEGFYVWGDDMIITTSAANTGPFAFHSIPAPGALVLLALASLARSRQRRR